MLNEVYETAKDQYMKSELKNLNEVIHIEQQNDDMQNLNEVIHLDTKSGDDSESLTEQKRRGRKPNNVEDDDEIDY